MNRNSLKQYLVVDLVIYDFTLHLIVSGQNYMILEVCCG